MTRDDRLIHLLTDWLEDQPASAPDRLLDSVLTDLQTATQRARWRAALRRFPMSASNALRFSAAAGAVAVAAVIGVALWAGQPPVGPGAQTARPTSSPRPIAHSPSGGLTALEPGAWSVADSFPFRASFDVPGGWQGTAHGGSYTGLFRDGDSQSEPFLAFAVVGNVYVDPCHFLDAGLLIPPIGPSVDDLTAALVGMDGADVSAPVDISVGGYRGKQLTVTAPESFEECSLGEPRYRLWTHPNGVDHWMEPRQVHRISILDVEGARVVIVAGEYPETPPGALAELGQVFSSIRLEPRQTATATPAGLATPRGSATVGPMWSPESASEDWPAPVRAELPGRPTIVPMSAVDEAGAAQASDARDDVAPTMADSADILRVGTWDCTWFPPAACVAFDMAEAATRPLPDPQARWMAFGIVVDTTGDGTADHRYGIDNGSGQVKTAADPRAYLAQRMWRTDLRTGKTESPVGVLEDPRVMDAVFPGDGSYFPADGVPSDSLQSVGSIYARRNRGEPFRFYVWASVISDGQVVATDYAPDVGWFEIP